MSLQAVLSLHPTNFNVLDLFSVRLTYFQISVEMSSLTHVFFRSMLFNLHFSCDFPVIFLLLISTSDPLWSENIFLFHCFKFVKCFMDPNYGSSECSVWVWEECVFCCHWLKSSVDVIRPSWLIMLFSSSVFLLNFYIPDPSMTDKMFWFLTIIMSSSIYPRNSVNFWHCC